MASIALTPADEVQAPNLPNPPGATADTDAPANDYFDWVNEPAPVVRTARRPTPVSLRPLRGPPGPATQPPCAAASGGWGCFVVQQTVLAIPRKANAALGNCNCNCN
eukprot:gene16769-11248_t